MPTCPGCQQSRSKRDGHSPSGRQRYACRSCRRDFTVHSGSAFSGYRFPPEVILTALRWYFSYALSAQQVMELLAERGVVDVLVREHRDTASAEAFFRQAQERTAGLPEEVVSDYHQPYIKALQHIWPDVLHRRSGLHRAQGITTKPVERSHIPTRDRLRNSRGLKTTATAQRFLEGFEALYALRHGHVAGVTIGCPEHDRVRQVTAAFLRLGRHLRRAR